MKITTIRTDKKNKQHVKTMKAEVLMKKMQADNRYSDIEHLRDYVMYAASYTTYANLHRLPYVYPSAEMRQTAEGTLTTKAFTGLLTLTVETLRERNEAEEVKRMAAILPCTFAALNGSSLRSVKIIVKTCRPDGSLQYSREVYIVFRRNHKKKSYLCTLILEILRYISNERSSSIYNNAIIQCLAVYC